MRKRLSLLLLALMPLTLFAKIWKPQEVPMTHLENKFRYVCNPDSILRESTVHYCDSLIRIIEDETGAQFVVVVVESLDGDDPYEFTYMFKYALNVPKGATSVTFPQDESVVVFAATACDETGLPDVVAAAPLFRTNNKTDELTDEAIKANLLAKAKVEYSDAWWEIRNNFLWQNGLYLLLAVIALAVFFLLYRRPIRSNMFRVSCS